MLPDLPPSPRGLDNESSHGARPWLWRLEGVDGSDVEVSEEYADQRFPTKADAESWVGEVWTELADQGVDAVTLFEAERRVYGPMSLHA